MAGGTAKTEGFTHVRVRVKNRERAKEVSRQIAAQESRTVAYSNLVDEILDEGLTKREKKLGL
jgi:hypothetical protein